MIASANGAGEAGPVAFSDVAPSSAQVGPGRCNSDLGGRSVPVELPILPKRVAENVGQFTGRAWLLPKILEWWDEGDERLFLLTGGPGTGKSMILAWLACNARYHIDAPTMHRQIADHYWAKHHDDWSKCDTYGIESLPIHLPMAQAWTKLEKLFLDPAWLETKTERLNIYALIQDYNLTSNVPHLLKLRNTLRLSAHVLLLDPSQLRAQLLGLHPVPKTPS